MCERLVIRVTDTSWPGQLWKARRDAGLLWPTTGPTPIGLLWHDVVTSGNYEVTMIPENCNTPSDIPRATDWDEFFKLYCGEK